MSIRSSVITPPQPWLHLQPEAERYSIELHEDVSAFDLWSEPWRELCETAAYCSPFQLPIWQQKWAEHLLGPKKLQLITLTRGGRLAGVAPMFAGERRSFYQRERVIEFLGAGDSDYLDFIYASGDIAALEALIHAVLDLEWDVIDLSALPERSETRRLFPKIVRQRQHFFQHYPSQVCPSAVLTGSFDEDRNLFSRKDMKRYTNALRREGKLEYRRITEPAELRDRMPQFFHQHRKRWAIDERTSQFNRQEQRQFFYDAAEHLNREGVLHFTALLSNDRPVAFHLGFLRNGELTYYKPSYNLAFEKFSPGIVLLRFLFEEAVEQGWKVFDFATGDESYKYRFANTMSHTHRLQAYRARGSYVAASLSRFYEISRERTKQTLKQNHAVRTIYEAYKRRDRQRQTTLVLASGMQEIARDETPAAVAGLHTTSRAKTQSPAALHVETVNSLDALQALAPEWNALFAKSHVSTINQTFDWVLNWWKTRRRGAQLRTLVARDPSGKLTGIAPLCSAKRRLHGLPARVIEFISTEDANYLDFIAAPRDLTRVAEAFLTHLLARKDSWDALFLAHIPEESHSPAEMRKLLEPLPVKWRVTPCSSSFLWKFGDREQDTRIAKKKNFNTKHNSFRKSGGFHVARAETHDEVDRVLDVLFEQQIERRSLTANPSKFLDPTQRDFFRAMAYSALDRGWLSLMSIVFNDKPIAIEFGFRLGRVFTRFIPSFDIRFAKRSPGELIMKFLYDDMLEWKIQECDHGRGPEPYKMHYSNALRYNSQIFVYRSRLLWVAGMLESGGIASVQAAKNFFKRSERLHAMVVKARRWRHRTKPSRSDEE